MKNWISLIIISLIICLGLASCGDDDEKFENIDFKTTGITFSQQSGNKYYGEVGSNGGDITFEATGKNASNGFLSQIKVGDFVYEVTDADRKQKMPHTVCEKEWGHIEITSVSPHITHIVLNTNDMDNSINYELIFGAGYKTSIVLLTQLKGK